MTKENENNSQPSSFRDQILRDLEELKAKRMEEQSESLNDIKEQVVEEIETIAGESHKETPREVVKVDRLAFPDSYLTEEKSEQDTPASVEPSTVASESLVDNKEVEEVNPASQNTVERNLEELRNLVAEHAPILEEPTIVQPTAEPVVEEPVEESVVVAPTPSLDETFIDFPKEDVSTLSGDTEIIPLEATLVAPAVTPSAEPAVAATQPRRRTHSKHSKQRRKKQDRAAKRIVAGIMSVVVVAVLATGIFGYLWVKSSLDPVDAQASESIQVEIPEGSSTLEIGKILFDKGLIKNATVFNYYSKIKSYNNYQSGFYNLKQSMSVDDIATALQESGTPTAQKEPSGKILIVEGYTLTQIAEAMTLNAKTEDDKTDKTPYTSEQFMSTITNQELIDRMVATYPKLFASLPAADSGAVYRLEGYLFPAVYDYNEDTPIEDVIEHMISTMDARLQPYYDTIASKNLTVNEVLTLASLVEKEGSTDEDRRNIASVFFNRLNAQMPLQSNIAILYAEGKLGQETTLAEDAAIDTSIDSPYNIYWRPGLMPGPVDSPSLAAIEAVINANTTDYLYFVADVTTGSVYFARTIEEHDQNVANYVNAHLE